MSRWLKRHRIATLARRTSTSFLAITIAAGLLPSESAPAWAPSVAKPAKAETLSSPRYVSAAVLPNGQVGLLFLNQSGSSGEIRFVRYTSEHVLGASAQLSTAAPMYPQLAVVGSTVVAAYVDTRSPNAGKLIFRTSADSGATWSSESNPFGTETFSSGTFAPRVVASRNAQTLYIFTSASNARPQYRSSTDLSNWTTAAAAGDTSMRVTTSNSCGNAYQECYRAHAFGFMETATTGNWLYITKSDAGWGQSGRGTQVGTLGGSWSTQVDHLGSGSLSGAGGESTATTFLDRNGIVYYLRVGEHGQYLYFKRSVDGGYSWQSVVHAYSPWLGDYVAAAPVGLYVPGYSFGEYVWFAGFGGTEDTLRVIPLWTRPAQYARTGSVRLIGSAGSDLDAASAFPYNHGLLARGMGAGGYTTSATDLALPGRLLPFAFTRTYNSADENRVGALGPGWTHSYEWSVLEKSDGATLKRGDGRRDWFTKNQDGSYTAPLGVTDKLVRNTDGSFSLTTREQIKYDIGTPGTRYRDQITSVTGYWRLGDSSGTTAGDTGPNSLSGTYSGTYALNASGAVAAESDTAASFGGGNVDMGSPSALHLSGTALSIEFWAQASGAASYRYLVSHTNGASQGYAVYTGGDATLHFYLGRSGGLHVTSGVSGTWDGAWHHIVATYDGANMKVYIDGAQQLSESETASMTAYAGNFRLADYNGGGLPWGGVLDEVAIYARVLPASEVTSHYLAGLAPTMVLTKTSEPAGNQLTLDYTGPELRKITDAVGRQIALAYDGAGRLSTLTDNAGRVVRYGYDASGRLTGVWDQLANATVYASVIAADNPAGYWRLDESSGSTVVDTQAVQNGTAGGSYTRGASGIAGWPAIDLSWGYVTIPSTGAFNFSGDFTIETWVYRTATGSDSWPTIVSKRPWVTGSEPGWGINLPSADPTKVGLHLANLDLPSTSMQTASGLITANTWHHLVLVYTTSDRKGRLYVDNSLALTTPATDGTTGFSSSAAIAIGRNNAGSGDYYFGRVDEVAIYPAALSTTRIAAHYTAGTAAAPASWAYAYDGVSRHVATLTDPDGRTLVTNTYDSSGRLSTQTDGRSKQTAFTYGSSTLTVTDPRSHDTVTTYDSRNRVLSVADVIGGTTYTTTYTYDDCGFRSSVINRRGNRTDYTYDTTCKGNLLELEEAQLDAQTPRFSTTWEYDTKNNPTLRTDAKGFTTSWTYDATSNVRLSETRQIDGSTTATTKWTYGDTNNPGLPTRIVFPRGNTTGTPDNTYSTVLAYTAGNLTSSTDADGNQTTYGYDSVGRRTSMVDPDGNASGGTPSQHTWTTAYDVLDRVTSETDPLSHSTSHTYDNAGHRKTTTDKNGNVTTYTYDDAGLLSTVQQKPDPVNSPGTVYTTTLARDDNGNVTSVTQGNGVVTDYAYDVVDRMTSMTTHPSGGTNLVTSYTLDGNGNVTTRTTADSVATTYTYDNLDRLTQVSATGLSTISYGYDELSRRTSMTDVTGTTNYTYDGMGRMTQAAQPNGTVSYAYDRDSNRTTLTYPGSLLVTYTYSNAGRLSSLSDWGSRSTSYTYSPSGLAATVTLPNNMITTYTYDRGQRLTGLTNVISGTTITSHTYTLDNEGNRTALSEFVSGITSGSSDSFGFTYDGLERLTAVTTTNAETFTLDGASNITARTGPSRTFTIDGSNRPTSDGTNTLTWSNADRLTGRGSDSFGYDPLDRLTSSTVSGTSRTYGYNGDGVLQSRTTGGSTVSLLWDPATSPTRLLSSGSDKIVYGLGPLYSVNGSTVTTYARDGQKSIRAELNGSSVNASWRYRAYGDIAQSNGSSAPSILGYAGQVLDPSGLYYMRARWYDAATQRFLSRDPLRDDDSSAFGYTVGNPLTFYDPAGTNDAAIDPGALSLNEGFAVVDACAEMGAGSSMAGCLKHVLTEPWRPTAIQTTQDVLVLTPGGWTVLNFAAAKGTAGGGGPNTGGGSSRSKKRPTYLYDKVAADETHLKYGITDSPETRYTKAELAGGRLKILAEGTREEMLALERDFHENLPVGPEEGQRFYVDLQKRRGYGP